MKKTLILIIGLYFTNAYSQTDYTFVYNNDSIINKGIKLYDKEQYKEAIKEFDKITKTDPKYTTALYEKGLALGALENKTEAKAYFENLHSDKKMEELPNLFTIYGSFLSDEKEYDKAEKIFKEGEKYLSNSSNFLYNFALLYIRKEENQKALDLLEKSITVNPNHASSHYLLGLMAFENGKITEGTMALMSYLVILPNGRHAEDAILKMNAKYGQNYLDKNKLVFTKTGDNFEEIETILRNQLPLKSAYKVKSKIDDVVIRQAQAVTEYAAEHKMGNGFFETTYIPWLKSIVEKNQFEGLSYYILLGMEEKLGKKLTSQKKKITTFYQDYMLKDFWSNFAKRNTDLFGKQTEVVVTLEGGVPYLVGAQVNGKREGKYKLLTKEGIVEGELNFKNDELDGVQKYFDEKGNITEQKNLVNGKLDGKYIFYYSNGNISTERTYKAGELNGMGTTYYVNGGKDCEVNFTNGERNGKLICQYPNGSKKTESNIVNGKFSGLSLNYNEAGDLTQSYSYLNDLFDGKCIEYYDGKIVKSEAVYKEGKTQGSYKSYFSNAVLEKENFYENGKLKKSISYFANGKKSLESIYNEKEEIESYSYFDSKENKYFEEKYKGGELKSGLQYSKTNPKPVEVNLMKKTFIMNDFNGNVLVSGEFEKGKKIKEWKHNYSSGSLRLKEMYAKGVQNGLSYQYDRNAQIGSIKNYTNDTINGVYEVYENGKLNRVFAYAKGQQNGPFKTFYSSGAISTEGFIIDGNVNYNKISYRQDGKISYIDKYINDNQTYSESYDTKGVKENTIDYKNRTGKFTTTYSNGTTSQILDMVNGEANGKSLFKDKFNTMIRESEYVNGIRHKSYKSYSPLGTIYSESTYYCGKLNGQDKSYDAVGNIRVVDENFFGDEHGKTTRYYYNKSKSSEFNQLDGMIEGDYYYYNLKGEALLILGYEQNSIKYYIKKNKAGELSEKVEIKGETAQIESLYPNGKTAIKFNLVKGNKEGKFIIYSMEGKPEIETDYTANLLNGQRIEYYVNGKIYRKENFSNQDFEGKQEYFKEDGKPWLTSNYKNDELHGNTLIYENGKLILTKKYDSNELVEIIK
ncbi:MAG: tetratricopeptide repeat protein [Bacteroidota bacterium]